MKNLVKTRTYRERSQPIARKKLGLLEKKKDYKLRAVDFHRKTDAIKTLKEKASFRNPEEFYYKMANTKTKARPPPCPLSLHGLRGELELRGSSQLARV